MQFAGRDSELVVNSKTFQTKEKHETNNNKNNNE